MTWQISKFVNSRLVRGGCLANKILLQEKGFCKTHTFARHTLVMYSITKVSLIYFLTKSSSYVLVSCPPQPSFVPCPPLRTPSPIPCPPLLSSSVLRSRPRHPLLSSIPVLHHHPITRRPLTNPDSCLPHWVYLLIMEHYPGGADHGA